MGRTPREILEELRRLDWSNLTPEQRQKHAAEWATAWRALLGESRRAFVGQVSTAVN